MHIPVLTEEVIQALYPRENENFIDCTFGEGGHSKAILECTAPSGKVLGIDWDASAVKLGKNLLKENPYKGRLELVQSNFARVKEIAGERGFLPVHGVLMDLGFSSTQLEESGRGFSFRRAEPIDMRFSEEVEITAEHIVNQWSREKIEQTLKAYGEERFAGRIAKAIVQARKDVEISTTSHLVEIIASAVPTIYKHQRLHFATRTFQALRIATNNELRNLEQALQGTWELLEEEGRIAVISFHSLEDRIVKTFFGQKRMQVITKKPIAPSRTEILTNPRARSAKLRAAKKVSRT